MYTDQVEQVTHVNVKHTSANLRYIVIFYVRYYNVIFREG